MEHAHTTNPGDEIKKQPTAEDLHGHGLLGMTVKDSLTGAKGVVTAVAHYLHDSPDVRMEGRKDDGCNWTTWISLSRVQLVE